MKIAFVFPGQGSQTVGMTAGLADSPAAQKVLGRADDALGSPLRNSWLRGRQKTLISL